LALTLLGVASCQAQGLTSEQERELRAILEEKLQRVEAGVQAWSRAGRDPSSVIQVMRRFQPLMEQGRPREGEAILDEALRLLGKKEESVTRAVQAPSASSLPKYLAFQIFTDRTPITGVSMDDSKPEILTRKDIANVVQSIIDKIGQRGTLQHKLGFVVGPLSLDATDNQLRQVIADAFSVAKEKNVAVGFHIDDNNFWGKRKLISKNPKNKEWLDWEGRPSTGRSISWDIKATKFFAPICFNSPEVQKELRRVGTEVIGREIKKGVRELTQLGREALFAGVIVGWETQIGDDFNSKKPLGYCALTNKGFSRTNPPSDFDYERSIIVKEYIEFWSKNIADAGVDTEKIFSHTEAMTKKVYDEEKAENPTRFKSYLEAVNFSPPSVSFGKYHNPGFSTYPGSNLFPELYAELIKNGSPPWASSEGTNLVPPGFRAEDSMETYLARMFNHGAVLVNIFGWGVGEEDYPYRVEAERSESLSAYRKFLNGKVLEESPIPDAYGLIGKVKKIQKKMPQWIQSGGEPKKVESLMGKLERYIEKSKLFEAESIADEILAIIGG
jgi:hypothetical protein